MSHKKWQRHRVRREGRGAAAAKKLQDFVSSATASTSFYEGFAFPAKRTKTNNQLAVSEPEKKDGAVVAADKE